MGGFMKVTAMATMGLCCILAFPILARGEPLTKWLQPAVPKTITDSSLSKSIPLKTTGSSEAAPYEGKVLNIAVTTCAVVHEPVAETFHAWRRCAVNLPEGSRIVGIKVFPEPRPTGGGFLIGPVSAVDPDHSWANIYLWRIRTSDDPLDERTVCPPVATPAYYQKFHKYESPSVIECSGSVDSDTTYYIDVDSTVSYGASLPRDDPGRVIGSMEISKNLELPLIRLLQVRYE